METVLHTVTFKLTKEQINHRAHRLAEAIADKEKIVNEKKTAMAHYKAQVEAKEELIGKLSYQITSGEMSEDVVCVVRKNFDTGMKEYIYEGEVVYSEPLSADDRQLSIAQ